MYSTTSLKKDVTLTEIKIDNIKLRELASYEKEFIDSLNKCEGGDVNTIYKFISTFGTHIISKAKMGARYRKSI